METPQIIENEAGFIGVGAAKIFDRADLRNKRGDPISADKVFDDEIEWAREQVSEAAGVIPAISFFTSFGIGYLGETELIFTGPNKDGKLINVSINAANLRYESTGTPENPWPIYDGSATARAVLIAAFGGFLTNRVLYPGYEARHPGAASPVGRLRRDWDPSGSTYELAAGVDPAAYPETDPASGKPNYRLHVDGAWGLFHRRRKSMGPSRSVPIWFRYGNAG